QERVYYRLGSEKAQEANFRLISSTNRDPLEAMREGHLREDLYYRINTIEIHVPPLRQRVEDIQHLADHFLDMFAKKYQREGSRLSQESYQRLFDYDWPGNVRELQHVIERAVLLSKSSVIDIESVPLGQLGVKAMAATAAESVRPVSSETIRSNSVNHADLSFDEIGQIIVDKVPDPKSGEPSFEVFAEVERAIISAALKRTKGNKQAAANLLSLYRPRLYSMIRKHKLMSPPQQVRESNVESRGVGQS
ncbi:MAG TPA: sigma 54-interacting transcriptional regulator, partial [Blastocatellia bacterium]